MAFSITAPSTAVTTIPLVQGYDVARESGNLVHEILGRTDPDITLKPLKLRSGTLTLFMGSNMADATDLVEQLEELGVQFLQSTEAPLADMYFVLSGSVKLAHDDDTQTFSVTVDFQEVLP